uniref:Villin 1 n=1 Tax=Hucho hucho TaxID=62062 RepID=A0A4W5RV55_9TELE
LPIQWQGHAVNRMVSNKWKPGLAVEVSINSILLSETSSNLIVLISKDFYLLDQGGIRIFIWKGKKASKTERSESLDKAEAYKKAKGYPIFTYVETVNDGAESAVFKQLFQRWSVKGQTVGMGTTNSPGKIGEPDLAAQQKMAYDGTGEAEVLRLEDSELVPVDRKWLGHFYAGDCYLILYKYEVSNRSHYILYIWQGRHASTGELAASAFQAVNIDQQYNGEPVQVRVPMGKEPLHLMAIFKGKIVIYEVANSTHVQPAVRLFHIHRTNEFNTRAIDVPARSSSLNSNDVFVLSTDTCCYLWYGKVSTISEKRHKKSTTSPHVSLSAPIRQAASWPWRSPTLTRTTWTKMTSCCWTSGTW